MFWLNFMLALRLFHFMADFLYQVLLLTFGKPQEVVVCSSACNMSTLGKFYVVRLGWQPSVHKFWMEC